MENIDSGIGEVINIVEKPSNDPPSNLAVIDTIDFFLFRNDKSWSW
ncbi:hypothetical protein [Peribacillus simplex]